MKVKDAMSTDLIVGYLPGTIKDALKVLAKHNVSGMPILKKDTKKVVGVITRNDIFKNPDDIEINIINHGITEGRLFAGCLSVISGLIGTPYMPDLTGSILVLEDVGEEPYRIDRNFSQLKLLLVFCFFSYQLLYIIYTSFFSKMLIIFLFI